MNELRLELLDSKSTPMEDFKDSDELTLLCVVYDSLIIHPYSFLVEVETNIVASFIAR